MIKRTTAFIFILFANIILLAHAVIPHHYHQIKICVEATHCQDDGVTHEQGASGEEHEHDGDESSTSCILNQATVLFTNQSKENFNSIHDTDRQQHFFTLTSSNTCNELIPTISWNVSFPLVNTIHSSFVTASLCLRAPPLV
ncbi:MAG: DUF6769 family protein [Salinivirgaceae bacterium]